MKVPLGSWRSTMLFRLWSSLAKSLKVYLIENGLWSSICPLNLSKVSWRCVTQRTRNSGIHVMLCRYLYLVLNIVLKSSLDCSWSSLTVWSSERKDEILLSSDLELLSAMILKPSLGVIEKEEVTCSLFSCTNGSKKERRSGGDWSMLRRMSHMPCSAATVSGPFLKTNSPVSLQT